MSEKTCPHDSFALCRGVAHAMVSTLTATEDYRNNFRSKAANTPEALLAPQSKNERDALAAGEAAIEILVGLADPDTTYCAFCPMKPIQQAAQRLLDK